MMKREKLKAKFEPENDDESQKSVILLSSSDDDEANEDLSLEIVKKAKMREVKRKRGENFDETKESEVVGSVEVISLSSGEEVEVVGGEGGGLVPTLVVQVAKKKKNRKKKKKSKDLVVEVKEEEKESTFKFVEEDLVETLESVKTTEALGTEPVDIHKPMETEVGASVVTEELVEKAKPGVTEVVELADNTVMRKLLRGPRYFDPPNSSWAPWTCHNCGEEGHVAVNCTMKKRQKPCFVCGSFEHAARKCTQGQECFICNKAGHRAKNCPQKDQGISQISNICLRCGDLGHNMFSCTSDYAPEDLKEIQCYICKRFGHLCCVDFIDTGPRDVSCYNCGLSGHTGSGCAKLRGETSGAGSSTLCYKCGEEGHFARGCTKFAKPKRRMGEFSTPPTKRFSREVEDLHGDRSLPHDINKPRKRKNIQHEERGFVTPRKSKHKGGWITDDPGDFPTRKAKANGWTSPAIPTQKAHKKSNSSKGGRFSSSRSPSKKTRLIHGSPSSHGSAKPYHGTPRSYGSAQPYHGTPRSHGSVQPYHGTPISHCSAQPYHGTPISHGSAQSYHHRFSASRFGYSSNSGMGRSYEW